MIWIRENKEGKPVTWYSEGLINDIKELLEPVLYSGKCNRCDGCGYENGCEDKTCGMYAAHKIWETFNFEDNDV